MKKMVEWFKKHLRKSQNQDAVEAEKKPRTYTWEEADRQARIADRMAMRTGYGPGASEGSSYAMRHARLLGDFRR